MSVSQRLPHADLLEHHGRRCGTFSLVIAEIAVISEGERISGSLIF
ncbi:MAG: hypothetical protein K9I59_10295 [Chlorobium sp.]|nr:hypothetical protein [Chlorobium sp.]MBN1278993.1 hypothetical protein [Chlorobiaceae bacterium]MCF8288423.1 hypothetical protein [Chlorobium sp.]MCF8386115.1 hypothetical protein [Chlorobium sp.]